VLASFPIFHTVTLKKPSIINLLHKNFPEEQLNTRFPVFPEGVSNSRTFPEVVDTLVEYKYTMDCG